MMQVIESLKTFAFISYNHKDVKWAKWLRRKLEWYRLPSEIHNEFEDSRYIRPVFRDRDELNSGVLGEELRKRLENSKYLIVICSPNSAQSDWVSDEVQAFIDMGRLEYIIPFVVEGSPQKYNDAAACESPLMGECFPLALRLWNTVHPKESLLGIAITDDGQTNKQKAFIRIVSRLLGVAFETLWQRHKREMRTLIVSSCIIMGVGIMLAYWFMLPVKVSIYLEDEKSSLPEMENGVLTVNGNEFIINHPDTTIEIGSFPGYYRMKNLNISFNANRFYNEENLSIKVTSGISQTNKIILHRDSTFAIFAGQVIFENENGELCPLGEVTITIDEQTTLTDENGRFKIEFPLPQQTVCKPIVLSKDGYISIKREDEVPSKNLKFIMRKS